MNLFNFPEQQRKYSQGLEYFAPINKRKKSKRRKFEPIPQCIAVSPDYFVIYNDTSELRRNLSISPGRKVERITDTGTMSRQAAQKMKRAFNYLTLIAKDRTIVNKSKGYKFKAKLIFITLTLSDNQVHSDNFIKNNLLKNFFDAIKARYSGISLVWKAETQDNGRIHFHICTDHPMPKKYVSELWNRIQFRYGYLNNYLAKNGHIKAPSTEIKKVRNSGEMAKYMRKYLLKGLKKYNINDLDQQIKNLELAVNREVDTVKKDFIKNKIKGLLKLIKEAKKRKITGRLWGCTDNLLLKPFRTETESFNINDRQKLFEYPVIIEEQYYQVFKINDFKAFINGFGDYTRNLLNEYFERIKPKVELKMFTFDTETNYSY